VQRKEFNTQAVIWKLIACGAFAGVNCLVRYLTGGSGFCPCPLSADTITFLQNVFGFLIMLPFLIKGGFQTFKTNYIFLHALRIASAVIGIIAMYSALAIMPMAQALALQFVGPVFTVIGARLFLNEKVGSYRMGGIVLSLIGAFIVSRPDKALITMENDLGWSVFLPLLSAIMFAISKLLARDLGVKGESPQLLAVYLLFFMIPASALPASFNWTMPGINELGLLVILGACGCLAHYATAKAYCLGEVTFLTPFGFARIFFTVLFGIIIFNEVPTDPFTYVGYAVVIIGILIISWGEKRKTAIVF